MDDDRLTREHVIWAYRLLLDRDPESEDAILPKLRAWRTTRELRMDIMSSEEFRLKNPDQAHSAHSTVVIKPLPSGVRIHIDLADYFIGLGILRGGYEQDEIDFALRVLREGDVAVDVGAHVGYFALQMAERVGPAGMIYAFEPFDGNADLLDCSIRDNHYEDRLRLERGAVADVTGTATLRFARETLNTGGAFLSERAVAGLGDLVARSVPTYRLDDYDLRRPVRLIKMDVEGAEPRVVRGAASLIAADHPTIVSEVHRDQLERTSGSSPAALIDQLRSLGLRAHRIEGGMLGPAVTASELPAIATLAFVAPPAA